jgi:hypothetical protein
MNRENDLFTYGPRPKIAQQLVKDLKAANVDYGTLNTEWQNWHNKAKGVKFQEELLQKFKGLLLHKVGLIGIRQQKPVSL